MNYQNPYYKSKNNDSYLKRLSFQLLLVFIIMLFLMILKFVNNDITSKVSTKIKESFYKDYTKETVDVFDAFVPNTKEVFEKIVTNNKNFVIDSMPVEGKIIVPFGENINVSSNESYKCYGIVIEAPEKSEVKAVYSGKIERVEYDDKTGISIVVNHGNGYKTRYSYLSDIKVTEGEKVTKGSVIAFSGKDKSLKPCLYFQLLKNDQPVNVEDYIKK